MSSQPSVIHELDPVLILSDRFTAAIRAAFPALDGEVDPLVAPAKQAAHGDFQCNAAMPLSKRVGKPPRDVAKAILANVNVSDICEPLTEASIAGPGFINIRLKLDALSSLLTKFSVETTGMRLGVVLPVKPQTVVVDLCGVNLAKEMHVGHLRATIIGDCLARVFGRLGHNAIRQNHFGDWGLPIAMVTGKVASEIAAGRTSLTALKLPDLDRYYKQATAECRTQSAPVEWITKYQLGPKAHAEWQDEFDRVAAAEVAMTRAKQTLVKLQSHDPAILAVWQRIADITIAACVENCRRLHAIVLPEHTAGESTYADELGPMVEDLLARGIAEHDGGAVVVKLDKPEWGDIPEPCIIRKGDGGYLYATTDMCAVRRRVQKLGAERVVYCVDGRQQLHFKQVFAAANRAGFTTTISGKKASLTHAWFGTILGDDGTPFKTRSGDNVRLADLIDEATQRAAAQVASRARDLTDAEKSAAAAALGVAAIKYADLSGDRVKDYVFSFDRMVSFEGNTGPYLLYALVRTRSIARKAAERGQSAGHAFRVAEPAEKNLALAILRYPGVLRSVAESYEPHRLCQYLYDLAGFFSQFFDQCPVLTADDEETSAARLALTDLAGRVLADGLETLGLPTVEKM